MKRNIKTYTKFLNEDLIPGGLADLRKPGEFNNLDLEQGATIEMEHTDDRMKALEIAMDHLTEDPSYYKKLSTIEIPEISNYMFFNSLKNIKKMVDSMIKLDPNKLDSLLSDHDWASNHIATSNDDITEVFQFMLSNLDSKMHEGVKYGVQHEGDMWNVYTKHPKTGVSMLYKTCEDRKEARLVFNNYKASLKK
jgi:hypothetical protein